MPAREVACPSCGAPVKFASAVSLLAVCGYCRASLLRRDLDLERIGTMAAALEDASPIQLGAEGRYRGSHFAVAGRLQIRYEHGAWNEWYVVFDDGRTGWLADAAGDFAISFPRDVREAVPAWEALRPGVVVTLAGVAYEVTDVRRAEVIGAEGELPFRVEGGHATASADLRGEGARFASLDYGDEPPRVYVGEAVELEALDVRGLREPDSWR